MKDNYVFVHSEEKKKSAEGGRNPGSQVYIEEVGNMTTIISRYLPKPNQL